MKFVGAIYDKQIVRHCAFTACSMCMATRWVAPIRHWSKRWCRQCRACARQQVQPLVAGEGAEYFDGADGCAAAFDSLVGDEPRLARMREASRLRHRGELPGRRFSASTNRCCWVICSLRVRRLQRPELRFTAVVCGFRLRRYPVGFHLRRSLPRCGCGARARCSSVRFRHAAVVPERQVGAGGVERF